MRRVSLIVLIMSCVLGCKKEAIKHSEVINKWADMSLYLTKNTPNNSPTYASRALAYIGLTMFESIAQISPNSVSLSGQLNGLIINTKADTQLVYEPMAVFNAAMPIILKEVYNQTSDANKLAIDSLETAINSQIDVGKSIKSSSIELGQAIAAEIVAWSKTDGGHRAYLRNFDKSFQGPEFQGSWKPPLFAQSFSHEPLHPYWGKNRRFVKKNESIKDPKFISFNSSSDSEYYKQFKAVYKKGNTLSINEKEMALWWGDDPDDTFTPPGHSFFLAQALINKKNLSLIDASALFAKTTMAVADSFIACWEWKYQFFSERANTFIPKYIDKDWESFWPDPPFPAFPSGHAIQAAAAATVFENSFGKEFVFVDSSHINRPADPIREVSFVPQEFNTFWQIAQETANSRFYGGIHTQQDNEAGLEKGKEIATNINKLKWKKE